MTEVFDAKEIEFINCVACGKPPRVAFSDKIVLCFNPECANFKIQYFTDEWKKLSLQVETHWRMKIRKELFEMGLKGEKGTI